MSNPNRRVQKQVQDPGYRIRVVGRDLSLGKAIPQFAVAIDAQIDRDDASDDFTKEKLHSNIHSSSTDPIPGRITLNRQGYGSHCIRRSWFGVAGFGVGSIAGMIAVTVWGSARSCDW
jgi:hypothetical protein